MLTVYKNYVYNMIILVGVIHDMYVLIIKLLFQDYANCFYKISMIPKQNI